MQQINNPPSPLLLAIVGMPGSGKSETAAYLLKNDFSVIRFGDATEEGLKEKGLPINPENEKQYREELRQTLGMEAYALKAEPKIKELSLRTDKIILDGLYSWEEYTYLSSRFPHLKLLHVYTEPQLRYKRLSERPERPFTEEQARERDCSEIEKLNKGGPIAAADYVVDNNQGITHLHDQLDRLLERLERNS